MSSRVPTIQWQIMKILRYKCVDKYHYITFTSHGGELIRYFRRNSGVANYHIFVKTVVNL